MNQTSSTYGAVVGQVKGWLRAEGLAVFIGSVVLYRNSGHAWWIFVALFLVPDVFMLGYLSGPKVGAASYNLVHTYVWPLALGAACISFGHFATLPYMFIWTAHIGIDRFLGYGLKYDSAFGRTHLSTIGKARKN
jgi:hypothetical protein